MDPLFNTILGVVFLGLGVAATVIMYRLRGAVVRPKPAAGVVTSEVEEEYLAAWHRPTDELETHMAEIHAMAESGQSIIEPMRTREKTISWNDLLIKGAQLAKQPLNEDQPVTTETIIGPAAAHPLVIDTPIFVTHMSFGALSREIKMALAKGSAAVKTAICTGEGGILEDELAAAYKCIFEYVPNQYSVSDESLRRVDAIEIKIGQSAKPGMGGLLPGNKVTDEIAAVRNRPKGVDIHSPAHFEDIRTPEDLKQKVLWLREMSGGKPIGVKLAAGDIEADLRFALAAGPDFITLDGRAGATGAAPKVIKDATSIPTLFTLCRARKFLDESGAKDVSLVITGGFRISSDFAKALALGADAVAIGTAALMAAGCQQYRICNTGRCPIGITSQDPQLRARLKVDKSAQRLANVLRVYTEELKSFARLTGNNDVHALSIDDLSTTNSEISGHTEIEHV
ncbi:MAG: FMN-binding glutamate synthase family protein [Pirellulales bacterium]|nr:FMN-binding glutamate synthase family protein [Pirellulales bacterium]